MSVKKDKNINADLELFARNLKEFDNKSLGGKKSGLKNRLKKLNKDKKLNWGEIKKVKKGLKAVNHQLSGRISVVKDEKVFFIKKNYFTKLKDKEKYIDNLYRNSLERKIAKLDDKALDSNQTKDFENLQDAVNKYENYYKDTKKYKSGITRGIRDRLKGQEDTPFSTFRYSEETRKTKYQLIIIGNTDNWMLTFMNIG